MSAGHPINHELAVLDADHIWQALEHRRRRLSYRDIGQLMGYSSSQVYRWVMDGVAMLRAESLESAEALRAIEVEALNKLESQLVDRLETTPKDSDFAKLAAALVRVSESRRKLQGLDAPTKVEVSGNLYTVKEASPACSAWDNPPARVE